MLRGERESVRERKKNSERERKKLRARKRCSGRETQDRRVGYRVDRNPQTDAQ